MHSSLRVSWRRESRVLQHRSGLALGVTFSLLSRLATQGVRCGSVPRPVPRRARPLRPERQRSPSHRYHSLAPSPLGLLHPPPLRLEPPSLLHLRHHSPQPQRRLGRRLPHLHASEGRCVQRYSFSAPLTARQRLGASCAVARLSRTLQESVRRRVQRVRHVAESLQVPREHRHDLSQLDRYCNGGVGRDRVLTRRSFHE